MNEIISLTDLFKLINKIIKMKAYIIMMLNGIVLIILGVYGYFISSSPTALISAAIGLILLILSFPVRNENSIAAHTGTGLTFIAAITFFIVGFLRSNTLIIVMAIITLFSLIFYIFDFFQRKKSRKGLIG